MDASPVTFLVVDRDRRAAAAFADALERRGVSSSRIVQHHDGDDVLRAIAALGAERVVAFVAWPREGAGARSLVRTLVAKGAHVCALLPPVAWQRALEVTAEGADDVVLMPCAPDALAARALLTADSMTRSRAAPWHRPRAALNEALAHPSGGTVVVRGIERTAHILVSRGRIAWIHDDGARDSLLEHLHAHGVPISAEELVTVVAECRQTGEHYADVLARWGLAEAEKVRAAARSVLEARLHDLMSWDRSSALFLPARWREPTTHAFSTDELGIVRASIVPSLPPRGTQRPPEDARHEPERQARLDSIVRNVRAIDGCMGTAVLHFGAAEMVSQTGEASPNGLAWTLGSALNELEDGGLDVLACGRERCHIVRRVAGHPDCFVYAAFDLATTSLALARRSLAHALEPSRSEPPGPIDP